MTYPLQPAYRSLFGNEKHPRTDIYDYVDSIPGTVRITMPTVDNKVRENLTSEQVQNLLKALDEESDQTLASLVRLALFTGMRRIALLNL